MSFALWTPFSYIAIKKYSFHYKDINKGSIDIKSVLFFILFIITLRVISAFYDKPEVWTESIVTYSSFSFFLFSFCVCLLAPIYEEIVFRGFLLNAFLLWGPKVKIYGIVLTSLSYSVLCILNITRLRPSSNYSLFPSYYVMQEYTKMD
ncbi:CPBP family intramembrane metalloprotease [Obesumbacterium proteus]|nr:CPBP family intramembrane metalloprotease [Obesumbacterium proteus]MCE9929642.1 CPBP family intramembrane metalloprotease [Obesumbacterium proteus]